MYQTSTIMKNGTQLFAFKLGGDKGFKRGETKEMVRIDENLCIPKWKEKTSLILLSH
jgi:hypothetical protein